MRMLRRIGLGLAAAGLITGLVGLLISEGVVTGIGCIVLFVGLMVGTRDPGLNVREQWNRGHSSLEDFHR